MVKQLILLALLFAAPLSTAARDISDAELKKIAGLIFHNECASKNSCLTAWNEGEEFASLGIGHFIWYPAGSKKTFSESFPALVTFLKQQGVELPGWLAADPARANPWTNRQSFLNAFDSAALSELRLLLVETKALQAQFMQQRFKRALPLLLSGRMPEKKRHIRQQFERVMASPMGLYVLIDYVNFKGEGTNPKEFYGGFGWGLLQVLENMQGGKVGVSAIEAFAASADKMLTRRVEFSPSERDESRWLPGWWKGLGSYVRAAKLLGQRRV